MSLPLMSSKCLIPRQDTEILVETALNLINKEKKLNTDLCSDPAILRLM